MAKFLDSQFSNATQDLDGNEFDRCTFHDSTLVYSGGDPPTIMNCQFSNTCRWEFRGAAERTVGFMRAIYHGAGEGGRQLIEQTFENIRKSFS